MLAWIVDSLGPYTSALAKINAIFLKLQNQNPYRWNGPISFAR
jgi:hypothetical protein